MNSQTCVSDKRLTKSTTAVSTPPPSLRGCAFGDARVHRCTQLGTGISISVVLAVYGESTLWRWQVLAKARKCH